MAVGKILVYKRLNDPERPVYSKRKLKHPLLAVLFGWFCAIVLAEEPVDKQPEVYSWSKVTRGIPNEIAGEVDVNLWEEYVRVYDNFRTLEKEVQLGIQTNIRLSGKPIDQTPQGIIYDESFKETDATASS